MPVVATDKSALPLAGAERAARAYVEIANVNKTYRRDGRETHALEHIDLMDSKNSKGKVGWGAQADWDQTLAILKNYRDLSTDKGWTAFHTTEFLPQ